MNKIIADLSFDQERALYGMSDIKVLNCHFGGEADGESALKECHDFEVQDCTFAMRYVLWHAQNFVLRNCKLDEATRAPLWYDSHGLIDNCKLHSVKNIRECQDITFVDCDIDSEEFGWKSSDLSFNNCQINSVYGFLDSKRLTINDAKLTGKYALQYVEDSTISNSHIETKDCLWHAKNVTVSNSTLVSEYLAWCSENLTLINCHIVSSQPLCYCKGLKLINCTFEIGDRSFEYSDINATIKGHITSIKNPLSGRIIVDSVGQIITEQDLKNCHCQIIVNNNNDNSQQS